MSKVDESALLVSGHQEQIISNIHSVTWASLDTNRKTNGNQHCSSYSNSNSYYSYDVANFIVLSGGLR